MWPQQQKSAAATYRKLLLTLQAQLRPQARDHFFASMLNIILEMPPRRFPRKCKKEFSRECKKLLRANKAGVENYWGHPRCMLISSEKLQKTVGFGNEDWGGGEETENRDRSDVNWSKYSSRPPALHQVTLHQTFPGMNYITWYSQRWYQILMYIISTTSCWLILPEFGDT